LQQGEAGKEMRKPKPDSLLEREERIIAGGEKAELGCELSTVPDMQ
jgi:hypothetical protein